MPLPSDAPEARYWLDRVRGVVALDLEGRHYRFCLTLGALAVLETRQGEAARTGRRLNAMDMKLVLAALSEGAGKPCEPTAFDSFAPGLVTAILEMLGTGAP